MDFMTSALIASWVAIVLLALVVSGLDGLDGLDRPEGPGPGGPPDEGVRVLLFLSDSCRSCAQVLAAAGDWAAGRGADAPALRALYAGPAPPEATAQRAVPVSADRAELFERYDAIATPFAVVIGADRRVLRSEPLGSTAALHSLLAAHTPAGERTTGEPATAAPAAELTGRTRSPR